MKELLFILNYFKDYKIWKRRVKEQPVIDFDRGCGYYILVGVFGYNPKGRIEEIEMKSGDTAICKLIDYETFSDPRDMIEHGYYQILGYKGEKLFKDMTFREYLNSIRIMK